MRQSILLTALIWAATALSAQKPAQYSSGEIRLMLHQANTLGSVLYVAAHPDDENTRLLQYLTKGLHLRAAYVSMTRGDGGQNLIGPEIRENLGIIRTDELLGARARDGASQYFSRANDFGYSKHPDETFNIWDKREVLSDLVWVIRKFRPDAMVNRFSVKPGITHGHHTASAILSVEAFDLAADPEAFPEQLKYVDPWQPKRLFFNTSWWFYRSREKFADADKSNMISLNTGQYYPLLGKSGMEVHAEARSSHRSQGFGAAGLRGDYLEWLENIKGDPAKEGILDGLDLSWNRIEGGAAVGKLIEQAMADFEDEQPWAIVPLLLEAHDLTRQLKDKHWSEVKRAELEQLIRACAGLYLATTCDDYTYVPGQLIEMETEVINRSPLDIVLTEMNHLVPAADTTMELKLEENKLQLFDKTVRIPAAWEYDQPYWLREAGTLGMFKVDDQQLRGLPKAPASLMVTYHLSIEGREFIFEEPVIFQKVAPEEGEQFRPVYLTPPAFCNFEQSVYLFPSEEAVEIPVVVKAGQDSVSGRLQLDLPQGWQCTPGSVDVDLAIKGQEKRFVFQVTAAGETGLESIGASLRMGGKDHNRQLLEFEYPHIPFEISMPEARVKAARMSLKKSDKRIGYIMGAGDVVPDFLRQLGYVVDMIDPEGQPDQLADFDVVIAGVRAYNTVPEMKYWQPALMEFVKQGGTYIVQYNTSFRLVTEDLAPYPLELSRGRVTVEEAPVRMLLPDHPALNRPNKITQADFEGWVQERGLYFPGEWSEQLQALISINDPGEDPLDGSLLVGNYGKGHYVYTGLSFFREFPGGVPGAFRLFTNLIELE